MLGGDGGKWRLFAGLGVVDERHAAPGEDIEADVAASRSTRRVVGEDGADEPDQGLAVGEDADDPVTPP
jgi:hypothetical protein